MATPLDDILKGTESPAVEQAKPEAPVVEAKAEAPAETAEQKAERERDERGRFTKKAEGETPAKPEAPKAEVTPKVETKAAPTAAEIPKPAIKPEAPQHVPVKALQEERRKRQEVERQLQELQQPKAPDVIQDPQGFQQHIQSDIQTRETNLRVNLSAAWAKKQYPDFDTTMESWHELTAENPFLYQQAVRQELPAEWAYQYVKRQQLMQEIGDPNEYRSKLEAEIRAKVEAEYSQKQPQQPQRPAAPTPPPSLASVPSNGPLTGGSSWNGPTPLSNIFRR